MYYSSKEDELLHYWRIARTAVGITRIDRLKYAARLYAMAHPDTTILRAYKTVDDLTRGYDHN